MWQCSHITVFGCHGCYFTPGGRWSWWPFWFKAKSQALLPRPKCLIEVEGRPAVATHSCCSLLQGCQGCGNALTSQFAAAMDVILRQEVAGVGGRFGSKPNPRPYFPASSVVLRWKEGQPLPPTAVVVSSRDAKDVAMLSHHSFQLPWMLFCARRSHQLVAILVQIQIQGPTSEAQVPC